MNNFIEVKHFEGKRNLSDMFTKEDRDTAHYILIRVLIMCDCIPTDNDYFLHPSDHHSRVMGGVKLGLETQRDPTSTISS